MQTLAFKGVLLAGDHVITSDLEHNSVSRPLRDGTCRYITLTRVADGTGTLNPDDIVSAISVDSPHRPERQQCNWDDSADRGDRRIAKERGIHFLVDAAQTAGVVPVDLQAMNIDLLAVPAQGLMGRQGPGHFTSRRE